MARFGGKDQITNWSEVGRHIPLELFLKYFQQPYEQIALQLELGAALESVGIGTETAVAIRLKRSAEKMDSDYGFHCGQLAKALSGKPETIALDLAASLQPQPGDFILAYSADGPYLNLTIDHEAFATRVYHRIMEMGPNYGSENLGRHALVVVDMSSPNIAKQMSVGHLRSTIIGDSISRIYKHLGYNVIKDNHIGDWGTQFGHLLHAIEAWGDLEEIAKNPIPELQKLYVRVSAAGDPKSEFYAESNLSDAEKEQQAAQVRNAGRALFLRLEEGDEEVRQKWQQIVEWSLADFEKMYEILGVDFDVVLGESFYEDMLQSIINEVEASDVGEMSEGALIVNLDHLNLPPAIVQKADGATLYMTRDLAGAKYRQDIMGAERQIYVVGEDQKQYFEQVFAVLELLGYRIAQHSQHVYFGMVKFGDGEKMSTRKGKVILLEDVIDEAVARAKAMADKSIYLTDPDEKSRVAQLVGIGAIKYNDLMSTPNRSIRFDWDTMMSVKGNSAPYIMYSRARALSTLEKSGHDGEIEKIVPTQPEEKALFMMLSEFPDAVRRAADGYNPSTIATYLYELSKAFTTFYERLSILGAETDQERLTRLGLAQAYASVVQTGMGLLGIELPDRM